MRSASAVAARFDTPFKQANIAYVNFAQGKIKPAEAVAQLERAEAEIHDAQRDLAALKPPPQAHTLHSMLLRLYDQNLDFAHQTTALARYVPDAEAALKPLNRDNRDLRSALRKAKTPQGQAHALAVFTARVDKVILALKRLDVPYVMLITHGDQIHSLRDTSALATKLERALQHRDAKLIAKLLVRFRRSLTKRHSRKALAAQAIAEYNRRYRFLSDAYADVSREETSDDPLQPTYLVEGRRRLCRRLGARH